MGERHIGNFWGTLVVIATIIFFLGFMSGAWPGGLVGAALLVVISLVTFAWVVGWPLRR
jgi:hypothetical protein